MSNRIDKIRKIVVLALFFIILLASFIWKFSGLEQMALNGVTQNVEEPQKTAKTILNGEWQSQYETWYQEQFNLKAPAVLFLNRFAWSAFHITTNQNLVVGKQDNLYEKNYVKNYLELTDIVTQEYLDIRMEQLGELQQKLEAKGKHLMIFITPSKAEIYPEDIPWNYMLCSNRTMATNYERLVEALDKQGIDYYDSIPYVRQLKEEGKFPVFPKTGTHWSQVTGSLVAQQLSDALEAEFGYDLNELTISYRETDTPLQPDADIFSTMNLLISPYDTYYEPVYTLAKEGADHPNVFIRGGSFLGQSASHLINTGCFGTNVHMENSNVFLNFYSQSLTMSSYDELNWEELIGDKELFILEVNQCAVQDMGFGVIEYLLTQID